mmetsp:Transcript_32903/g.75752  ORF Transcript_32903/g.75752 Transcript_32903/m.75752 type:complete len:237 (-) Transcript_32903:122-832(-)
MYHYTALFYSVCLNLLFLLQFGPFVFQGLFLKRQKKISAKFSKYIAGEVLTSKKMWHSILTDVSTKRNMHFLFASRLKPILNVATMGLVFGPNSQLISLLSQKIVGRLKDHVDPVHGYVDEALDIENTLRTRMQAMTPRQFDRVLHPVIEREEPLLIAFGAVLGFAAGHLQEIFSEGQPAMQAMEAAKMWVLSVFERVEKALGRLFDELLPAVGQKIRQGSIVFAQIVREKIFFEI